MKEERKGLRDRNLDEATFEEKLEIISKLGIKVYSSEDLKSMRVLCQFNLEDVQSRTSTSQTITREKEANVESESATECGKVMNGSPSRIRTYNLAVNSRPLYR